MTSKPLSGRTLAYGGACPGALILVVEDNPTLLRTTALTLRAAGCEVLEATTAEECFRSVAERRPDLVLMDVVLPDMSGIDACRRFKSHPDTASLFVVLISGFQTSSDSHVKGLEAGADAYILRPIQNRELVARIQALLRLEQAQKSLRTAQEQLERRVRERTAELSEANARLLAEIAERRELEARLLRYQKIQALGELSAGVAHDFNNLLTVIKGNISLLLAEGGLSGDAAGYAEQVALATDRAASLTRQLLLFSRQEIFRPGPVNLNELVQNLSKMLYRTLGEHISLRLELASDLSLARVDAGMIEQAILNLAVNARDAMSGGGVLTVRTRVAAVGSADLARAPEAREGVFVCLSVADTGCGMDAATRQRIFEPFFTTKEVGKGTGLGLAAVHGIVGRHQGWVEVETVVGAGSTFSLYLPQSTKSADGVREATGSAPVGRGTETILLVEDEDSVRALALTVLLRHGYQVLPAVSGVEALQVWASDRDRIDLVLTDVVMPEGTSGTQLARRLREEKPGIKIILCSGYGAEVMHEDDGMLATIPYLQKPYDPHVLVRTVRECLDGKTSGPGV